MYNIFAYMLSPARLVFKEDLILRQTTIINKATADKKWYVVDASNLIVGRLATQVAMILRGKNKPYFTPHVDCGDNVIIINADKIKFTGNKLDGKNYYRHSLYPGGLRVRTARTVLKKFPTRILEHAIKGMLPRTRLGADQFRNLFVYADHQHRHAAQQPIELKLTTSKTVKGEKVNE